MRQEEMNKTNEEEVVIENTESEVGAEESADAILSELEETKAQLDEKSRKCEEYMGMLQRAAAEFDNYKKRTAREKESLYSEAVGDAVAVFLPVVDNMERALGACSAEGDGGSLREGVEMIFKQLKESMKSLGVEEILSKGETFDPNLHNAVMHIEDEDYGAGEIVEEFQKGYKLKEKVLRHSMVKVAN